MDKERKKAAIAAFKKQQSSAGIFAVRCTASGEVWVGKAQNLDTIQNRVWFSLRHGSSPHRELREAWNSHGADQITFQVLERIEHEELSYVRNALLNERASHWQTVLNALAI